MDLGSTCTRGLRQKGVELRNNNAGTGARLSLGDSPSATSGKARIVRRRVDTDGRHDPEEAEQYIGICAATAIEKLTNSVCMQRSGPCTTDR